MLNPGPPPENITVGAGPPLPQMKTSSRLVLHCNILNTYSFSRAGHNGPHFCSQVSVKRSSCFQCWNAELSTLFVCVWLMKLRFTCTAETCTRATETQEKNGSNAVSYGCPLRLGTVTACAVLTQKNKLQKKEKSQSKDQDRDRILPTDQSPMPTEGCCGAPSQTESGAGKSKKKAKRMGSERWPRFIGCGRLGTASQRSGGAQCYRFNECKRGRRGLPLMLSSALEDARNRGSASHGGPGSGRGTCPGERRQEPFV